MIILMFVFTLVPAFVISAAVVRTTCTYDRIISDTEQEKAMQRFNR